MTDALSAASDLLDSATKSVVAVDHYVPAWIRKNRSAREEQIVRGLSQVGSSAVVLPLAAIAAGLMLLRGQAGDARRTAASAALGALTGSILQHLLYRERPPEGREKTSSSSFPSTHSVTATAAYATVATTLLESESLAARAVGVSIITFVVPFIPASRIFLGMHWTSDVVGSSAIGASLALAVCSVCQRD
jgi:undecaprenyl-diphosphatase